MDILEPELVWVEGQCYRFFDKPAWFQGNDLGSYEEETYEPDYISDEDVDDESIEIVQVRSERYKHSFYVNSNFYRFIIGAKGATLKRLAADTKTTIYIPKLGTDGNVVISGSNKRDIVAARRRIDLLIETSRSKLEFTHFISIPTNSDEIKENFKKFKEDILKTCNEGVRGIKEGLFQIPDRLHFTISMLVLLDEEDRKKAINALEVCKKNIIIPILEKNGPITMEFKGLEFMNDDPREVNVLYIQVHENSGCLQKISDEIDSYFIDQGLARRQNRNNVKLHVTVMNTSFIKKEIQENNGVEKFDVTNILKVHKNTFFGKMNLSAIHISQKHSRPREIYYQATCKIDV